MRHVLAVDDDEAILDMVQMVLEGDGYVVHLARDGAEALRLLETARPELILLDMRMPVMNGWQFAEAYRKTPGPHVPIVIVTAALEAPQAATDIGASGCLSKPFDVDQLISVVNRHTSIGLA